MRSGCGRTRSIESNPFLKSAPRYFHAVRQHEGALELARGNAAVDILPAFVVLLAAADDELALLYRDIELGRG